ncbi:MAG: glycosyltransferase, partial [Candidatus Aenigmarchaeota archaeon]|nr:glycosyltransferase [Candidatus Aenigmarchaeota archaeon]
MKKTVVLVGSGVVSIPPRAGGATELIIYEISRKMPKDMLSVYVFDRKESHNKRNEIIDGAFYIRYKVPKFGNVFVLRLTEFIFGMRALKKIREISGRTRVDIVHAHTVFSSLPFALLKWLVPGKAKLIYTCHNPAWTAEDRMDFLNGIIMKIEGYVMRRFDFVTTVSDTMKESIIKKGRI